MSSVRQSQMWVVCSESCRRHRDQVALHVGSLPRTADAQRDCSSDSGGPRVAAPKREMAEPGGASEREWSWAFIPALQQLVWVVPPRSPAQAHAGRADGAADANAACGWVAVAWVVP